MLNTWCLISPQLEVLSGPGHCIFQNHIPEAQWTWPHSLAHIVISYHSGILVSLVYVTRGGGANNQRCRVIPTSTFTQEIRVRKTCSPQNDFLSGPQTSLTVCAPRSCITRFKLQVTCLIFLSGLIWLQKKQMSLNVSGVEKKTDCLPSLGGDSRWRPGRDIENLLSKYFFLQLWKLMTRERRTLIWVSHP